MKYHGGVSWDEQYRMPVAYKRWFLDRLKTEVENSDASAGTTAHGAATPKRNIDMRTLQRMFSTERDTAGAGPRGAGS